MEDITLEAIIYFLVLGFIKIWRFLLFQKDDGQLNFLRGFLKSRLIWIQNYQSYRGNVYLLNVQRSVSRSKIIILFLHFRNEVSF